VIDVTGRVLAVSTGQPAELMLIDGTNPNTAVGSWTPTTYRDAAQLVTALPTEIRQVTSYAGVDPATGGLTLTLNGTVRRARQRREPEDKLARLLACACAGLNGVCELDRHRRSRRRRRPRGLTSTFRVGKRYDRCNRKHERADSTQHRRFT
jgi:hypothetical protein